MSSQLDKYIEIKQLANPTDAFERIENELIDIMYPDHLSKGSLIMFMLVLTQIDKG